eukprot:COSAG02_NODE_2050_length_10003_cov_585.950525_1_plen_103_part_00
METHRHRERERERVAERGLAAPHPAADGAAGGGGEHWGGCILTIPSYRQANRHERQRDREVERQSGGETERQSGGEAARLAESVCVCGTWEGGCTSSSSSGW